MITQGSRVNKPIHELEPGEYTYDDESTCWYAHCPGPDDLVANLGSHTVIEHTDGVITVTPSILCTDGKAGHSWHGYLEAGVWREV